MKVYSLTYDYNLVTVWLDVKESEHRVELFYNLPDFIERVKYILNAESSLYHIAADVEQFTNIKTYAGELNEVNSNFVVNPF
jgi:hypothetical protein